MNDRRSWERFEPTESEENIFLDYQGRRIPGIANDVSQGGLSVIVMGTCQVEPDSEMTLVYRGKPVPVVARNVDEHLGTTVIGLEWNGGPIPALLD